MTRKPCSRFSYIFQSLVTSSAAVGDGLVAMVGSSVGVPVRAVGVAVAIMKGVGVGAGVSVGVKTRVGVKTGSVNVAMAVMGSVGVVAGMLVSGSTRVAVKAAVAPGGEATADWMGFSAALLKSAVRTKTSNPNSTKLTRPLKIPFSRFIA